METGSAARRETNGSSDPQREESLDAVTSEAQERRQTDENEHTAADREDPQPFSTTDHVQLTLDRSDAAAVLRISPRQELPGSIHVDQSRVNIGETVGVAWDLSGVETRLLNHMDFLGMFDVSEGAPIEIDNLLDSKLRGFNSSKSGRINWLIQSDHFHGRASVDVTFCYFDHQHNLQAQSSTITLVDPTPTPPTAPPTSLAAATDGHTPFEIQVYGIRCRNLRSKTFGSPDPFLKLALGCSRGVAKQPHHGQKAVSGVVYESTNPRWSQRFPFQALPSDLLEVTVRDKFSPSRPTMSHFLGKVKVQLSDFLQYSGTKTLTFDLQKRLPSDRVGGTITLTIENSSLPPPPPDSEVELQQVELHVPTEAAASVVVVVPTLPPSSSSSLRPSRLASLCSEDSISSCDDYHAPFTDVQEEGGATPGDDTNLGVNDDVIVNENRVQSSESDVGVQVAETATAESAITENKTTTEGEVDVATMETPSGEPKEQQVVVGGNFAESTQNAGDEDAPNVGADNEKTKSLDELDLIRMTLYGSKQRFPAARKRSHTVLNRHVSLRAPRPQKSHDESSSERLSGSTSMYQINSSPTDLSETLPPNWEIRSGASGMPRYYDHVNKVVSLDKPVTGTGQSSPRISDFVRRSNLNLWQRQPSQPAPESSNDDSSPLTRSRTISGDVRLRNKRDKPVQPDEGVSHVIGYHGETKRLSLAETLSTPVQVSTAEIKISGAAGDEGVNTEKGSRSEEVKQVTFESEDGDEEDETVKSKDGHLLLARTRSVDDSVRKSPGFCFITRPDLYKFAKEIGNEEFFNNLAVLELVQTIRSDHTLFPKYQHSSKLVKVVNSFALTDCDLPPGWEKRVDPHSKRHVFIDHNSRQTTFIDPRLPYPGNNLTTGEDQKTPGVVTRSRPYVPEESNELRPQPRPRLPSQFSSRQNMEEPQQIRHASFSNFTTDQLEVTPRRGPLSPTHSEEVPLPLLSSPSLDSQDGGSNYSERVVTFLRQPDIFVLLRSRYDGSITYNIRDAIETIRNEGIPALERMQRDGESLYFDLTIILSLFEEEISHFTFPVASVRSHTSETPATIDRGQPLHLSHSISLSSTSSGSSEGLATSVLLSGLVEQVEQVEQHASVDLDNHTYDGVPIDYIIEFFKQQNIYLQVLSRFNGITSEHREYIEWFKRTSRTGAEDRLRRSSTLRSFVDGLETRIGEFVLSEHPDSAHSLRFNSVLSGSSHASSSEDQNRMLAGMTMEQILTFFRDAEDNDRILAPDILLPMIGELNASELVELLRVDTDVRSVIMRYRGEILQLSRPQSLPTIHQIKNFFTQPNIYSIITSLNIFTVITLENRATVERIINTPADILSERLLWDTNMSRFISALTNAILEYDSDWLRPAVATHTSQTTPTPPPPPLFSRSKKQEFIEKLRQLQVKLERGGYSDSDSTQNANFTRKNLLGDAYRFIMGTSAKDLRRRRLNVHWGQEEGLDYGGPQREFFFKLSRQLFNPYYGLFDYSASGSYTVQISSLSGVIDDALHWFRFAGRLIGYAIIQGQLLDVFFARHVYKALLGSNYTVSDIQAIDIPFYNSLTYVLQNDPEPLDLTFTVLEETFGEVTEYELKPGGAYINVVSENKHEYVELMVQWRLSNGILPQTESMVEGLREMIPREYLSSFDAQELEWVIAGTPEINLDDWKNNTIYWGGYHADHHVIKWFWQVVEAYSTEQKLRLLQFVIGTSSIPFEGFKALRGSSSLQKFTIDRKGGINAATSLPIAHTCFNRMDLPEYPSIEMLVDKLTIAIEECGSFENA